MQVIEKHLVTFRDLEELQLNNQKLMAALRELSDEKDAEEMRRESKEVTQLKVTLTVNFFYFICFCLIVMICCKFTLTMFFEFHIRPGVGKLRPTGQIWPEDVFKNLCTSILQMFYKN